MLEYSKWLVPSLLCLWLAGCASTAREAQDAVLAALPDKRGVSYDSLRRYPNGVVCGYYTADDVMTLQATRRPFVYQAGWVQLQPSSEQQAIFCSTDQPAALYAQLGIGSPPGEPLPAALLQIRADLHALNTAIEAYREARGVLPESEHWRAALLPPDGNHLSTWPTDPWGNEYIYEPGLGGRVRAGFSLYTLGADAQPGGEGLAADVGIHWLRYLDLLPAER